MVSDLDWIPSCVLSVFALVVWVSFLSKRKTNCINRLRTKNAFQKKKKKKKSINILTHSMLGIKFSRRYFEIVSYFSPENRLTFHVN